MFIAKYRDGRIITEDEMVWDEVPEGMHILELTIPIEVSYIDPATKEVKRAPARTVSLRGFDKCYFYNEAVASIAANGGKGGSEGKLVAKAIGGIYGDNVVEIRMDQHGFSTVSNFKSDLLNHTGIKKAA